MSQPEWYQATDKTWIDIFVDRTERYADRQYAMCNQDTLTYGELREQVDHLASGLIRKGIRPGQTLAIWMTNCLEFLVCQWATYRVGATLLPLYSYYRKRELKHALLDASPAVLFTKSDFAGKFDARTELTSLLSEMGPEEARSFAANSQIVTLDDWALPGIMTISHLARLGVPVEERGLSFARGRTTPFDVMNVMYTSGTTGVPKGGLSMHRNNMATIHLWSQEANLSPQDILLCHVPLFTNFGALSGSALALYNGASLVVTEVFNAASSLREIGERGVTYVLGTPEMFHMLLEDQAFENADMSSVRGGHVAGSYLRPGLMAEVIDKMAPEIMQAYGLSECGGLSTITTVRDPYDTRIHTVGRPLASSLVEVRDPMSGIAVPAGQEGEIWLGDAWPGSCVGKGYLGASETTATAITADGWFRTGDLGRFDANGYLYFVGRLKNMITVGGFNVYPKEIELFLEELPGVQAAVVVGVPDDRLGNVPAAFVIPNEESELEVDELYAAVKRNLSSQKQPRHIWLIRYEELPFTPSGKIQTSRLAEWATTRMGSKV